MPATTPQPALYRATAAIPSIDARAGDYVMDDGRRLTVMRDADRSAIAPAEWTLLRVATPRTEQTPRRGVFSPPYRNQDGAIIAVAVRTDGTRLAEMTYTDESEREDVSARLWTLLDAEDPQPEGAA